MSYQRMDASKSIAETPGDRYISMKEVSRLFSISKWTVYSMVAKGVVRQYVPFPGSKSVRYKLSELDEAFKERPNDGDSRQSVAD